MQKDFFEGRLILDKELFILTYAKNQMRKGTPKEGVTLDDYIQATRELYNDLNLLYPLDNIVRDYDKSIWYKYEV
jgi:hypothetical protein